MGDLPPFVMHFRIIGQASPFFLKGTIMAKVNSISIEGDVITFETIGAETLRVNPFAYSPEIQRQLIILGAKTRIGNASHMERNPETGLSATPQEKADAMRAVHETLLTGEWSTRRAGGGAGREAGITLRALAEVQGLPVDAMRQRIDQLAEKKGVKPAALLRKLAGAEAVAKVIARMKAESAGAEDADDLLAELED